jgi:hypothetical protein
MSFEDIQSLTTHLERTLGYDPKYVTSWLLQFTEEDYPNLLTHPLDAIIQTYPISPAEKEQRELRLTSGKTLLAAKEEALDLWG